VELLEELEVKQSDGSGNIAGSEFADDIFQCSRSRVRQTRREKREAQKKAGLVRAKDRPAKGQSADCELNVTRADLQLLQTEDSTLEHLHMAAQEEKAGRW